MSHLYGRCGGQDKYFSVDANQNLKPTMHAFILHPVKSTESRASERCWFFMNHDRFDHMETVITIRPWRPWLATGVGFVDTMFIRAQTVDA